MKHKHYDYIVAWAEGKQIQVRATKYQEWEDRPNSGTDEYPWYNAYEYRIKPTPKSPGQLLWEEFGGNLNSWMNDMGENTAWEVHAKRFLETYNKQQQELMK